MPADDFARAVAQVSQGASVFEEELRKIARDMAMQVTYLGQPLNGPNPEVYGVAEYWPPGFSRSTEDADGHPVVVYHVTSEPRVKRDVKGRHPRSRKRLADVAATYFGRVIARHGLRPVGEATGTIQEEMRAGWGTPALTRVIHYEIKCAVQPIVGWAEQPEPEEEFIVLEMGQRP